MRQRLQAFELSLFLTPHVFKYVARNLICPGGSPNDQIRNRKHSMTDTELMHSFPTYSQEPPVQQHPLLIARSHLTSELFTMHSCSLVFTYAEIKSNTNKLPLLNVIS